LKFDGLLISDKAVITLRSVNRDLFISIDSLAVLPSVPVSEIRSLPARSTNYILAEVSCAPSAVNAFTVIVKIVCDREDCIFSL
jgi:hypothetical protein